MNEPRDTEEEYSHVVRGLKFKLKPARLIPMLDQENRECLKFFKTELYKLSCIRVCRGEISTSELEYILHNKLEGL